jgi:sigma-E factor negative regulatory protein RseC
MATEEGIVIKVGGPTTHTAWVKTVQSSACKSCSAQHSCNQNSKGQDREVEAVNLVNAKVGDLIQISIDTRALLKATLLLYIFPIVCMLAGGLIGNTIGVRMGMNPSPASALIAVASFLGALGIVRIRAGRMALKLEYRPKITRIIGRAALDPAVSGVPVACGVHAAGGI